MPMNRVQKESYAMEKKSLFLLLYLFYLAGVRHDEVILRSFGFHFDPTCNFKAIVGKGSDVHKYAIHIFSSTARVDFEAVDKPGEINLFAISKKRTADLYVPKQAFHAYFSNSDFVATGILEGKPFDLHFEGQGEQSFINRILARKDDSQKNEPFLLWLMRLFVSKLPIDLVMGAGINKDYGAKNWTELVTSLNSTYYGGSEEDEAEVHHYAGKDLLTSPSLYRSSTFHVYKALAHELYEFEEARSFNDPNSTLYKCVDFLESHRGTSVITYNYDTNLEYLCKKRKLLYCTVYDDNSFSVKNAVATIYHVHGLLPYERYDQRKFTDSLIFTESDYYYLYNNPYSWNVAKQLHDFKFNVCFFLGISLTDPDMKRLLELAQNYLKFNFIFMKKEEGYEEKAFETIASYFFSFDLIIVWVDDYAEIGEWLKKL